MYRLRFFLTLLKCYFAKPADLLDRYDLNFVALPLVDADVTRLFTQTYASWTALGRWHYVFSSSFKKTALQNHWLPVTITENIQYIRSVKVGDLVQLQTQVICWDERCFYLKQEFIVRGRVYAVGLSEGIIRSPQGHLKPTEIFKALGIQTASPPMPSEIQFWSAMRPPKHIVANGSDQRSD